MSDALQPDQADIDEANSYLRFDIQPLTRALCAMLEIEAASRGNATFRAHLSAACPQWGQGAADTVLALAHLVRRQIDHLAELTRVEPIRANAATLDPTAPRH